MPRPHKPRRVGAVPKCSVFKPAGIPLGRGGFIELRIDELEALNLADMRGMYHEQAAEALGISRPTFTRLLAEARKKVATAIIEARPLRIEGGNIEICGMRRFLCLACKYEFDEPFGTGRPQECPQCNEDQLQRTDTGRHRHGGGRGRRE
ncbi:MAG: DUF134 domain-containing protein [Planctomycetes bacterium]|nr:DUF134 domain-containing protein [Planctomycetota bacterium]